MPPRALSRHFFCQGVKDKDDNLVLTDPEPFSYRDAADNTFHTVLAGETLWTLAEHYFASISEEPALLWWIIADYQPSPVCHDPTVELTPGQVLAIPSPRTVLEDIFSESRRDG